MARGRDGIDCNECLFFRINSCGSIVRIKLVGGNGPLPGFHSPGD